MRVDSKSHTTCHRVPVLIAVVVFATTSATACATTSVDVTVKRAPALPVFKTQQVALMPVEARGHIEFETSYACGGTTAGQLGPIPESRLHGYAKKLGKLVREVLTANGVSVVDVDEAEKTLRISATMVERKVSILKRCDENASRAYGLNCLPDPVSDGKSTCGCVLLNKGKLNPANYDWVLWAMGDLDIEVVARLESAEGELIAEETFPIFPDSGESATVIQSCTHVRGHPTVVKSCLRTNMVGKTLTESTPDFKSRFKAILASAMAQENGGRWVHDTMFPFDVQLKYVIYKVDAPEEVAGAAVEALKAGRFADAIVLFEKGLGTVRQGVALSVEDRARFIYDYGVALLGAGKLPEAKAAILEAQGIQADEHFDDAMQEIERQISDRAQL